ncbi:MAG: c-type cytochrome [Planctomycetes bacterium]|nr:c-type cytochrome [Planctomycetota bacterium]
MCHALRVAENLQNAWRDASADLRPVVRAAARLAVRPVVQPAAWPVRRTGVGGGRTRRAAVSQLLFGLPRRSGQRPQPRERLAVDATARLHLGRVETGADARAHRARDHPRPARHGDGRVALAARRGGHRAPRGLPARTLRARHGARRPAPPRQPRRRRVGHARARGPRGGRRFHSRAGRHVGRPPQRPAGRRVARGCFLSRQLRRLPRRARRRQRPARLFHPPAATRLHRGGEPRALQPHGAVRGGLRRTARHRDAGLAAGGDAAADRRRQRVRVPHLHPAMRRSAARPLALAAALLLAACGGAAGESEHEFGRRVYNARCYFCHGYSGDAKTLAASVLQPPPRDFTRAAALRAPQIVAALRNGRPGTAMASFRGVLDAREMQAVAAFVEREFVREARPNTAYHTAANGWPDHERHAAAFPFALGRLAADVPAEQLDETQRRGRQLFLTACISCHEPAGADPGPAWSTRPVSYPRLGFVPGQVDVDAVSSASVYAKHDAAPHLDGLSAAERRGEALFQANCAFCHGGDGTGRNWIGQFMEPPARDLTRYDRRSMPPARLRQVIRDGLAGTSMPAWRSVLAPAEIGAVAAYVQRAFLRPDGPPAGHSRSTRASAADAEAASAAGPADGATSGAISGAIGPLPSTSVSAGAARR